MLGEIDSFRKQLISKDKEIEQLNQEINLRPTLQQMNAKKIQIDHLSEQLEQVQTQNNHLHNEIMELRNQTHTHLTDLNMTEQSHIMGQSSILDSVIPNKGFNSKIGQHSQGDAKMVLDEICQILQLQDNDPVNLLETVRKLERVVKAVPRMEQFIHNLSIAMSETVINMAP